MQHLETSESRGRVSHTHPEYVPRRYSTQKQPVYHKRGEVFVFYGTPGRDQLRCMGS